MGAERGDYSLSVSRTRKTATGLEQEIQIWQKSFLIIAAVCLAHVELSKLVISKPTRRIPKSA